MTGNPLPRLDDRAEHELRSSIALHGVLVPILIDQHGEIFDGHHRQRIATDLEVPCPVAPITVPDDPEGRAALLATINDARRQRLSPQERHALVAELRARGLSQRAIAGQTGVGRATVRRDLRPQVGPPAQDPGIPDGNGDRDLSWSRSERPPKPRKKPERSWLQRLRRLDDGLAYVLQHRPPNEARTREALRIVESIRRRLEGHLASLGNTDAQARVDAEPLHVVEETLFPSQTSIYDPAS